jgi:RimJ/RimL family protein N-acetyltransferase
MYKFANVSDFIKEYKKGKINYPYKRVYFLGDDGDMKIKQMMSNLSHYDIHRENRLQQLQGIKISGLKIKAEFQGNPQLLISKESDYENYNVLSDMFMEQERMKCTLINRQYSPFQYFHKFPQKVASVCLETFGKITPKNMSDTMWKFKEAQECTNFRPPNLVAVIQHFFPDYQTNPVYILDPSSGWGDRMMAAIATGSHYTGIDPNTALIKPYKNMINFFDEYDTKSRITMINSGFEDPELKLPYFGKYDLVFTSPPYFKMENYSSEKTQSANKYTTENSWFNQFLIPYLNKGVEALKPGGVIVIVINQIHKNTYVYDMLNHMSVKWKHTIQYLGVLPYGKVENKNKTQPMFVWQKTEKGNPKKPSDSASEQNEIKEKNPKKNQIENNKNSELSSSLQDIQKAYQKTKTSRICLRRFNMKKDLDPLSKIQADSDNMSNIASGKSKTPEETKKQLKYWIEDYKQLGKGDYGAFYPIILKKEKVLIGYIGFYKGDQLKGANLIKNKWMIRILIDKSHTGKGLGTEIQKSFSNQMRKVGIQLYSMVDVANEPGNKINSKVGNKPQTQFKYHNKKYNLYEL